jgi:hypothetical protein
MVVLALVAWPPSGPSVLMQSSTGASFSQPYITNSKNKAIMAKELTVQEQREMLANPIIQEVKKFEMQQRMAQMYATSGIVPKTYDKNIGGCVIAIDMAMRMMVNPLAVMQNLNIVYGMPSWSAKFLVACINRCGRFTELEYEKVGDDASKKDYKCRAVAYAKSDIKKEHPLYGAWITWPLVDGEGWSKKNGSKWLTMPEQMFMYRAASFWSSAYAPDISLGFPTTDEVVDGAVVDVEAVPMVTEPEQVDTETGEITEPKEEAPAEPEAQAQENVKEQPATKPETPADAIKQAIKKQAANQPAADKPGERQEGNLFDQQ